MDPLYVIIEDGRLSPLSFDSTQSTLIFEAPQVGNALLHEIEEDLAALSDEGDSDGESEVDAEELADAEDLADAVEAGVADNAGIADDEQSNDSAYFSSV
nr:unnamed protein product [Callosobruchus analis]CAI5847395.1 unnamed protein product [Callosobruchus analis]CAI5856625.1 unnamed protein product [Callosobruchus analis]CAI5858309.1 unnamed protein product [Callosobruchus analis]CAI5860023.1 unnamed protein product [Callosobruchus analis]